MNEKHDKQAIADKSQQLRYLKEFRAFNKVLDEFGYISDTNNKLIFNDEKNLLINRDNKLGSFDGKYGSYGKNRSKGVISTGKCNFDKINVATQLKLLNLGPKMRFKNLINEGKGVPSNYYPNYNAILNNPSTTKFDKARRTSSVIESAIHKQTNVDLVDPSFTLLQNNISPSQYNIEYSRIIPKVENGPFYKDKRCKTPNIQTIALPGPGFYEQKPFETTRTFKLSITSNTNEIVSGTSELIGPGYQNKKYRQIEKKVPGFSQQQSKKTVTKNNNTSNLEQVQKMIAEENKKEGKTEDYKKLAKKQIDRSKRDSSQHQIRHKEYNDRCISVRSKSIELFKSVESEYKLNYKYKVNKSKLKDVEKKNDFLNKLLTFLFKIKLRNNLLNASLEHIKSEKLRKKKLMLEKFDINNI